MSEPPAVVLALRGVTKRYRDGARGGEVTALAGASLEVHAGETVLLRGASGAGKSTLLGIATGLILPTEGEVVFAGESFSRLRETFRAQLRREKLGVVLQGLGLVAGMSVLENVTLATVPDGALTPATLDRAHALLARLGIADLANARVETLSGGERQRVALVRSLVHESALLVWDEPTAHLDPAHAHTVTALLVEHTSRGGSALVATHDPRVFEALSGARLIGLAHGRLHPHTHTHAHTHPLTHTPSTH